MGEVAKMRGGKGLLDLRRAQNASIMLSRFKMTTSQLCAAVMSLDAGVLSLDDVTSLTQYVPTAEEVCEFPRSLESQTPIFFS